MLADFLSAPAFSWSMLALVFVEGLAAFLSPCILPMLPVYLLYLAGDDAALSGAPHGAAAIGVIGEVKPGDARARRRLLANTLCFVLGFMLVFMAMGAGATALGRALHDHLVWLTRLSGVLLVVLGLQYVGLLRIGWLARAGGRQGPRGALSPLRAVAFGAAFAVTWTPCVGTFLGAALMLAGRSASLWQGLGMLACFSLGLGVPFTLAALLYDRLAHALGFMRRHVRTIQWVSGALLIVFGVLMLTGVFGAWSGLFT